MNTIQQIETSFRLIRERGYVKSQRPNNKDGGIGNTLEDLLGVKENNLKEADFMGFEVKSQRELTSSVVSLFSKAPSHPKNANAFLKDTYGEIRDNSNMKKLYASIFGHRDTCVYEKYYMRLIVDCENENIKLVIKDKNGTKIDGNTYWTFADLKKASLKLQNLLFVSVDTRKENECFLFHYKSAKLFFGFDFNRFIQSIQSGSIQFDLRIGVHQSGKNAGKPHDHGSGFRIKSAELNRLFQSYRSIE